MHGRTGIRNLLKNNDEWDFLMDFSEGGIHKADARNLGVYGFGQMFVNRLRHGRGDRQSV
jgi:hypothetical protein